MAISSISSTSVSAAGLAPNTSAASLERQIADVEKKIQAEKQSKTDDTKTKATKLTQYYQQLERLNAQLSKSHVTGK